MNDHRARCEELLTDRATRDLSEQDCKELDEILMQHPEWDDESFELAAAALDVALQPKLEVMPDTVRHRLKKDALAWSAGPRSQVDSPSVTSLESHKSRRRSIPLGWLAAAAALTIAIIGWWSGSRTPANLQPTELRQQLLAQTTDAVTLEWDATEDPAAGGATGDVVWSAARQQGYMRIRGLQVNDPSVLQYQLWVFDRARDERYPVDGGVFDAAAGEFIVPIRVAVQVSDAHLFAVTVEKPGGVVVSDRERIVLLATAPQDQG